MRPPLLRLATILLLTLELFMLAACEDRAVETTPVADVGAKIEAVRVEVAEELKQAEARVIEQGEDGEDDAGQRADAE